jgi:uncharacterized protein (DUF927 family)
MAKAKKTEDKKTEEKPLTFAQKLSKVNADYIRLKENPDSDKKAEKPKTLSEAIKNIDFSRPATTVKKTVSKSKSKRGPSSAGRISGLQGLNPRLGQQFS